MQYAEITMRMALYTRRMAGKRLTGAPVWKKKERTPSGTIVCMQFNINVIEMQVNLCKFKDLSPKSGQVSIHSQLKISCPCSK